MLKNGPKVKKRGMKAKKNNTKTGKNFNRAATRMFSLTVRPELGASENVMLT